MLEASRQSILARLPGTALVLDVGGGGSPFQRADWVIDLMPYRDRGLYGPPIVSESERFSEATWVVRDICAHEPWPFADKQFDFVICSHTLEDVRDPIWVCHEMVRVGKAGYIEVPSRLEEQSYGFQGPWVGWGHHRWLIDINEDGITFVFKHHVVHGRPSDHFESGFHETLDAEQRIQRLYWEGEFGYRERVIMGASELDAYVADFVAAHRPPSRRLPGTARRLRAILRHVSRRGGG